MSETVLSTNHDIANAMAARRAEREAADAPADAAAASGEEHEDEAPEGGAPEPDQEAVDADDPVIGVLEDEDDEPEANALPASDAPASWPKDRLKEWSALDEATREIIRSRESDVQAAISDKGREAAEARRQVDEAKSRLETEYTDRINKLDDLLPKLAARAQSRWEGYDWRKAADEMLPEEYNRLRAEYDADMQAMRDAQAERDKAAGEKLAAYRQAEHRKLLDRNPQYAGEKGQKLLLEEAGRVQTFAEGLDGVSPDQLQNISADIYGVLRDAMKYREAVKKASARPQKKPAQKSVKPGARAPAESVAKRDLDKARKKVREVRGRGVNAENAALAQLLAAKRQGK